MVSMPADVAEKALSALTGAGVWEPRAALQAASASGRSMAALADKALVLWQSFTATQKSRKQNGAHGGDGGTAGAMDMDDHDDDRVGVPGGPRRPHGLGDEDAHDASAVDKSAQAAAQVGEEEALMWRCACSVVSERAAALSVEAATLRGARATALGEESMHMRDVSCAMECLQMHGLIALCMHARC